MEVSSHYCRFWLVGISKKNPNPSAYFIRKNTIFPAKKSPQHNTKVILISKSRDPYAQPTNHPKSIPYQPYLINQTLLNSIQLTI